MDDRSSFVGDVLDFRGIMFAPVMPEGVKDLLLTLLPDLQMRDVTYWPDGTGSVQRRVGEAWQRLQVAFAVHSQEVKGHVAATGPIDLVICYVDDWGDCPVEVLPLKPRTTTEALSRPEASSVLQTSLPEPERDMLSAIAEPVDLDTYLARRSAATRYLFQRLHQAIRALSPEIRMTVTRGQREQGGMSYACPEHVFLFVTFQKQHGLGVAAFTRGQTWPGVKPLSAPRWGSLRVRREDELARAIEIAKQSYGAIRAAIARGEPTGMRGDRGGSPRRGGGRRGR
jgi:hypothetical protein